MSPKQTVEREVIRVADQAARLFNCIIGNNLSISYNLVGLTGSEAVSENGRHTLRLNESAIRKDLRTVLREIIPHEIAHFVCHIRPDLGGGHNEGWQNVCMALGGTGEAYHDIDLQPSRQHKKFSYIGTCGTKVTLGAKVHKDIQSGGTRTIKETGGVISKNDYFPSKPTLRVVK